MNLKSTTRATFWKVLWAVVTIASMALAAGAPGDFPG